MARIIRAGPPLADESSHEGEVDPVDELVGRGEPLVGQGAANGEAPQPGGLRRCDSRLGVLECDRVAGIDAEPLERSQVALGMRLSVRDVVRSDDVVTSPAIPAASTTGSISARNAPETIATGTRSAA